MNRRHARGVQLLALYCSPVGPSGTPSALAMQTGSAIVDSPAVTPDASRVRADRPPSAAAVRASVTSLWSLAFTASIAALLVIGHAPLLVKFLQNLNTRPQYEFYPLVMLAAAALGWDRLREAADERGREALTRRGSWRVALALFALSFAVLAAGAGLRLRWVAPLSGWLTLAGVVWRIGGATLARALWPAGLMLLVIVPPPMHLDQVLATKLRTLAVAASDGALDLISVPHAVSGNVIEIPGHRLLIEEACTGLNSLMAVIAFSLLYGLWWRRPVGTLVLLVVSSAVTVVVANIFRITFGAWLQATYDVNLLKGSAHELVGLVLFAACIGVVTGVDAILARLSRRRRAATRAPRGPRRGVTFQPASTTNEADRHDASAALRRPVIAGKGRWVWWPLALAFAGLGVYVQVHLGPYWRASRLDENAKFSLPAQVAGWELQAESDRFVERPALVGSRSHVWTFRRGNLSAVVGLDYPFHGYHDVAGCYTATGWSLLAREDVQPVDAGVTRRFAAAEIRNPRDANGYVLFGTFDESGTWHAPVERAVGGSLADRLRTAQRLAEEVPTYQLQALLVTPSPPTPEERSMVRQLFQVAQEELSRQTLAQLTHR